MNGNRYSQDEIEIRPIEKGDYYWLLYLKNQRHIRDMERNTEPYYTENFLNNFIRKIEKGRKAKKDYFYIIEIKKAPPITIPFTVEETRAGFIRIQQKEDEKWYIGLGVDRNCLGKDVATVSIEKLCERHMGINEFLANVDPENLPSIGLFKKSGFEKIDEKENYFVYRKKNTAVY